MKRPLIRTPLPGPIGSRLIGIDHTYVSPSYTRVYPLVVKRGEGLWIHDVDDNLFLDFTAGIAVCATGHCHPEVVEAIKAQADQLLHMSGTDSYYEPQILLGCGQNTMRFCPALTIGEAEIDAGLSLFEEAVRGAEGRNRLKDGIAS